MDIIDSSSNQQVAEVVKIMEWELSLSDGWLLHNSCSCKVVENKFSSLVYFHLKTILFFSSKEKLFCFLPKPKNKTFLLCKLILYKIGLHFPVTGVLVHFQTENHRLRGC